MSFLPFINPLVSAGLSGLSGVAGRDRRKPQSRTDAQKQELIDQLMSSLTGSGPLSDLFNVDEAAFQKSFVDPAKQLFESQIAPQIQQQYIASGQQRGGGVQDSLTRAGVDLDQLLNQQFAQMLQQSQQNKIGAINQILGAQVGQGSPGQSVGSSFLQGAAGALPDFADPLGQLIGGFFNREKRKGFGG